MVMGRIKKELKEICLLDQVYVKAEDGKQSVAQYVAQVATGDLTLDDSWDEYVGTLESMGVGQLMDIYQAAYDAGISAE